MSVTISRVADFVFKITSVSRWLHKGPRSAPQTGVTDVFTLSCWITLSKYSRTLHKMVLGWWIAEWVVWAFWPCMWWKVGMPARFLGGKTERTITFGKTRRKYNTLNWIFREVWWKMNKGFVLSQDTIHYQKLVKTAMNIPYERRQNVLNWQATVPF